MLTETYRDISIEPKSVRFEALQEGLAVVAEYLVGGLNRSRMRLLAGRVRAVASLVAGADFWRHSAH